MSGKLDADSVVILYRVETREPDKHGDYYGPFTGPNNAEIYEANVYHFNTLPSAQMDIPKFWDAGLHCAFPSMEALRRWMAYKDVPETLQHAGYVIRVLAVPRNAVHAGKSGHQCGFIRTAAELIEELQPLEALT